jgi:hypothetical protein
LQLANLMLQRSAFGGRHHHLAGTHRRQRALGVKGAASGTAGWGPMPCRRAPTIQTCPARRSPARLPPSLPPTSAAVQHRRDHLNPVDRHSHRQSHTPGADQGYTLSGPLGGCFSGFVAKSDC